MNGTLFRSGNRYNKKLQVLSAKSAEELAAQIASIFPHIEIVAMYCDNKGIHYAHILSNAKIIRSNQNG